MTIETGPSQSAVRPAATADARRAKGQSNGGASAGAGTMGGFMAIMASLDASKVAESTTAMPVDAPQPGNKGIATKYEAPPSLCAGLKKAFEQRDGLSIGIDSDAKAIAVVDPEDPIETDPGTALVLALTALQPQRELPQGTPSLLAQSSSLPDQATTGTEPVSPDLAVQLATSAVAGAKLPHSAGKPDGAAVLNELAAGFPLEPNGKTGKSQKDVSARLASVSAALGTPPESTGRIDARSMLGDAKLTEGAVIPIATALVMTNTVTLDRRDGQTRDGSIFRTNLNEGTPIAPSYLQSTFNAVTPGAAEPPMPTDMYVAEKVAYWISNDVQSAEMKLDGIGVDPVEVSIRMQGNEAHIFFRTDELQARAALENAGVHLKDLLQREGLVLSGVSVGTSDAGGAGEQERRSRQGGKQTTVATVQSTSADRGAVSHRISGGSLDLFV